MHRRDQDHGFGSNPALAVRFLPSRAWSKVGGADHGSPLANPELGLTLIDPSAAPKDKEEAMKWLPGVDADGVIGLVGIPSLSRISGRDDGDGMLPLARWDVDADTRGNDTENGGGLSSPHADP